MLSSQTDPATLEGDALTQWYLRSPDEVEQQRQAAASERYQSYFGAGEELPQEPVVDRSGAGPNDRHELIDIGNPANRKLKREYERTYGPWPKTETDQNYHVAHIRAIADGGTNTLDNIRPMHPDAHMTEHLASGDSARWGRRPSIARAFGGRVAPGLGLWSIIPDITGIISGRIRTGSFDNFANDMIGMPSQEDLRKFYSDRTA